jgi:serine/threonine protein kinase
VTIPGIGTATAAALVAKAVDIDRFATPAQFVGYFGAFPEEDSSGVDKQGQPLPPGTETFRAPLALRKGEDDPGLDEEARMSLDPNRVEHLFADALDLTDPGARAQLLDRECGANPALRRRVEELLAAYAAAGSFLEGDAPPAPEAVATVDAVASVSRTFPEGLSRPLPQVPGYRTLALLGEGGMGSVYRAADQRLQRPVALKVLTGASAGRLARFQTEARAAARLQHPNIVQVFDVGTQPGMAYLVLELVEGGSLAGRLGGKPQPPREAALLLRRVALAVQHAHEHGIVHRDLTPANVLLAPPGAAPTDRPGAPPPGSDAPAAPLSGWEPKIADFGLACLLETEQRYTRDGEIVGTPGYMAPEQAAGRVGQIRPAPDVYALGAMLYEMLTGRPPFQGHTLADTVEQVLNNEPVPPRQLQPKVPRDLETICLKCLQKEPPRRYGSARELTEDLERFLGGLAIRARPVSRPDRLWRWAKRNPTVAGLLTAVSTLLVALAVGSTVAAVLLYDLRQQAERSARDARAAEQDRAEQLWQSLLERSAAGRASGLAGQRFDGLEAVRKAAAIRPSLEVRNEAIACLALADIRPVSPPLPAPRVPLRVPAVNVPTGRRAVPEGADVRVFDRGGKLVQRLTHPDLVLQVGWRPDGRLLAVGCEDLRVYVWRMPEGKRHAVLDAGMAADIGVIFSPSGRLLQATSTSDVGQVWDPAGGRLLVREAGTRLPLTFGPDDRHLGFPPTWELAPSEVCRAIHHTGLADKVGDGEAVRIWGAWFNLSGRRLITLGGSAVLWDLDAGAELARLPGAMAAFLPGGGLIGVRGHRQVFRRAALDAPDEHLLFTLHPDTPKTIARDVIGLTADGRWAAVADPGADRFVLIDPAGGRAPVFLEQSDAYDAAFSPDGRLVATSSCCRPTRRRRCASGNCRPAGWSANCRWAPGRWSRSGRTAAGS